MNVWLVNHYAIPPTRAGGTRHYTLARELHEQGVNVTLIASSVDYLTRTETQDAAGRAFWREEIGGIPFVWIKTPEYGEGLGGRLWNTVFFAFQVVRARWAEGLAPPDVIVGSSPSLFAAFAASHLAKRLKKPFLMEVRDIWPQSLLDVGNFSPAHPGIRLMAWMERQLYRRARRIITLLPFARQHIAQVVPGAEERTVWVPNGVDLQLAPHAVPPPVRKPLTLMYTGAYGAANGLDTVLDAAKLLAVEVGAGEVRFRLVGDGPHKARLQERVREEGIAGVNFDAPVPKEQVHGLLQEADGFLMVLGDSPVFRWGISPNKLFDYLLAARPVLFGVNTPFNPVEEVNAGFTVPSEDAEALAVAVRQLRDTPIAERRAMGARGRAYVEANHDMKKLAGRLAGVFREVRA